MISLLDPHTHTYKIAEQADHVADAEVPFSFLQFPCLPLGPLNFLPVNYFPNLLLHFNFPELLLDQGELGTNVVWMFPKLWSPDTPAKKDAHH